MISISHDSACTPQQYNLIHKNKVYVLSPVSHEKISNYQY